MNLSFTQAITQLSAGELMSGSLTPTNTEFRDIGSKSAYN